MKMMEKEVMKALAELPYITRESDGMFSYTIGLDYYDSISKETVIKVLETKDPLGNFYDLIYDAYQERLWDEEAEIADNVRAILTDENGAYSGGFSDEEEEMFREFLGEHFSCLLPWDDFLQQTFCVNIVIDSGDANYDFVLNSYSSIYYDENGKVDDEAGIAWLAKAQGYTKKDLEECLSGESENPCKFLKSIRQELINTTSSLNAVVFLVKMSLKDILELNVILTQDNPDCWNIVLDKSTRCGLWDSWNGAGGIMGIELEKDITIPLKNIWSLAPDGLIKYSVSDIYGVRDSFWTDDALKQINCLDSPEKPAKLS